MEESAWCPSCGDEYEAHIERCADCGVPLVDQPVRLAADADRGGAVPVRTGAPVTTAFDVSDLDEHDVAAVLKHLEVRPVPHQWVAERIIVAAPGYEAELAAVIDRYRNDGDRSGRIAARGRPLTMSRRGLAWLVDTSLAFGILGLLSLRFDGAALVAFVSVGAALHVVGLGQRGRSLGKAIVGATVRRRMGEPLDWGEALFRWLLRDVFATIFAVGVLADAGSSRALLIIVSVVAGIGSAAVAQADSFGRATHDLAVDSVVYAVGTIVANERIRPEIV